MKGFNQLEFLRQSIKIDSTKQAERMRKFLTKTLEEHGFQPNVDDAGNVICSRGDGGSHLVLNTHIDTVTPHISFEETEDRIKGRGSCDAKGPLSAFLKAFIEADIDGKLTLAVTPDEETTLQASKKLDLEADAFLVGEPTDLDPCIAARGWTKVEITLEGEAAHASEPEKGVSTIKAASEAIQSLETFEQGYSYENDLLPDPDLSATIIEGGEAENQVPARCTVTVDRRIVPPETPEEFKSKMIQHLEKEVSTDADIQVHLPEETEPLSAFETNSEAEIVKIIKQETGNDTRIFDAATEASRFNKSDVVIFGPGVLADEKGGVAHSTREYVEKQKVEKAGSQSVSIVETFLS